MFRLTTRYTVNTSLTKGLRFFAISFWKLFKKFSMVQGLKSKQEKYQGPLAACARCAGAIPELQSSLVSYMPKKTQAAKMEKKWDEYLNIYDFSVPTFFSIPICALLLLVRTLGFPTRPWWASRTGRYPPRPWGQAEYQELSTVPITLEYHKYVDQILNMNTLPPPSSPSSRRTTSHHILSSFTSHRSSIQKPIAVSWFTIKFIINCPSFMTHFSVLPVLVNSLTKAGPTRMSGLHTAAFPSCHCPPQVGIACHPNPENLPAYKMASPSKTSYITSRHTEDPKQLALFGQNLPLSIIC